MVFLTQHSNERNVVAFLHMQGWRLQTPQMAETANDLRGFSLPSLWWESGIGNDRDCPFAVCSSRHLGGLQASLVARFNAKMEAII